MFVSPLYLEILRTESVHDEPINSDTSGVIVILDIPALVLVFFHNLAALLPAVFSLAVSLRIFLLSPAFASVTRVALFLVGSFFPSRWIGVTGTSPRLILVSINQARIQVFFGCSETPLRLSAICSLYSNPQMLIFPCPLNFIVVFNLPN